MTAVAPVPTEITDYVRATARFLSLPLDEAQVLRVGTHLARTQRMVESLKAFDMDPEVEPAEVYCPAPFPSGDT